MTKWLVEYDSSDKPEKVEVVKQTEKTVTIKRKDWHGKEYTTKRVNPDIFDTFDQAKAFIVGRQERMILSLRLQLDRENGRLGNIKGLRNPDEVNQ